jgi:hypothetical protein
VLRGGSWNNDPANARAAYRNDNDPTNANDNNGARLVVARAAHDSTARASKPGRVRSGAHRRARLPN